MIYDTVMKCDLFGSLSPEESKLVFARAETRRFNDGATIFQRGDTSTFLVIPQKGRVRIVLISEEGKEIILTIIEPGEAFGEIALFDGKERSADAVAEGDCELLILERESVLSAIRTNPDIALKLIQVFCERMRRTTEQVEMVAMLNLPVRLARLLLRMAGSHGQQDGKNIRVHSGLNQTDYGQFIAATRESINKQLRAWMNEGIIDLDKGDIVINRLNELHDLAGFPPE